MIRIIVSDKNYLKFSINEKLNVTKLKKLIRIGTNIVRDRDITALVIELDIKYKVDKSSHKLIEKILAKIIDLPIIIIAS